MPSQQERYWRDAAIRIAREEAARLTGLGLGEGLELPMQPWYVRHAPWLIGGGIAALGLYKWHQQKKGFSPNPLASMQRKYYCEIPDSKSLGIAVAETDEEFAGPLCSMGEELSKYDPKGEYFFFLLWKILGRPLDTSIYSSRGEPYAFLTAERIVPEHLFPTLEKAVSGDRVSRMLVAAIMEEPSIAALSSDSLVFIGECLDSLPKNKRWRIFWYIERLEDKERLFDRYSDCKKEIQKTLSPSNRPSNWPDDCTYKLTNKQRKEIKKLISLPYKEALEYFAVLSKDINQEWTRRNIKTTLFKELHHLFLVSENRAPLAGMTPKDVIYKDFSDFKKAVQYIKTKKNESLPTIAQPDAETATVLVSYFGRDFLRWLEEMEKRGINLHDATYWLPLSKENKREIGNFLLKKLLLKHDGKPTLCKPVGVKDGRVYYGTYRGEDGKKKYVFDCTPKEQLVRAEAIVNNWENLSKEDKKKSFFDIYHTALINAYKNVQDERFAQAAKSAKVKEKDYPTYEAIWMQRTKRDNLPDIRIEEQGYNFYKIDHNDPRSVFAGLYTGCCQHPGGDGACCAWYSVLSPDSAIYAIEDKDGKMIAMSWAWTTKDIFVFDSIETSGSKGEHSNKTEKVIVSLYNQAADQILATGKYSEVRVGLLNSLRIKTDWKKSKGPGAFLPVDYINTCRKLILDPYSDATKWYNNEFFFQQMIIKKRRPSPYLVSNKEDLQRIYGITILDCDYIAKLIWQKGEITEDFDETFFDYGFDFDEHDHAFGISASHSVYLFGVHIGSKDVYYKIVPKDYSGENMSIESEEEVSVLSEERQKIYNAIMKEIDAEKAIIIIDEEGLIDCLKDAIHHLDIPYLSDRRITDALKKSFDVPNQDSKGNFSLWGIGDASLADSEDEKTLIGVYKTEEDAEKGLNFAEILGATDNDGLHTEIIIARRKKIQASNWLDDFRNWQEIDEDEE